MITIKSGEFTSRSIPIKSGYEWVNMGGPEFDLERMLHIGRPDPSRDFWRIKEQTMWGQRGNQYAVYQADPKMMEELSDDAANQIWDKAGGFQ